MSSVDQALAEVTRELQKQHSSTAFEVQRWGPGPSSADVKVLPDEEKRKRRASKGLTKAQKGVRRSMSTLGDRLEGAVDRAKGRILRELEGLKRKTKGRKGKKK